MTANPTTPPADAVERLQGWTIWDAEARMAREGDWRGVAYSIAHSILPSVDGGAGSHVYQERARMQIKAADRLEAAIAAFAQPSAPSGAETA